MPIIVAPNLTRSGSVHVILPDSTPAGHYAVAFTDPGEWSLAPAAEQHLYPTRERAIAAVQRAFTKGTPYRNIAAFRVPDPDRQGDIEGEALRVVLPR